MSAAADDAIACLLVASLTEGTGNRSTALRIAEHLHADAVVSCQQPASAVAGLPRLRTLVVIHALRCAEHVLAAAGGVWVVVVLGGTDVNEHVHQSPDRRATIIRVLRRADRIVAFSPLMADLVSALDSDNLRHKVVVICPAVTIHSTGALSTGADATLLRRRFPAIGDGDAALLLPAGIRPVKDPVFAVEAVCRWNASRRGDQPGVFLVVVGPLLDAGYASTVFFPALAAASHCVFYQPTVPPALLHASLPHFTALVNTSTSEGLSNSIVEAMALGVPVIARDIAGNRQLVDHLRTGLLVTDPDQLPRYAHQLATDPDLRCRLVTAARQLYHTAYSIDRERAEYQALLP